MEEEKVVGRLEYEAAGQVMTITHTYAYEQGRGIGRLLVVATIDYARNQKMKIIPQCSYAKALMERNEEFRKMIQ